ncbi:AMP-binding protein [Streptomyces mirabilis]
MTTDGQRSFLLEGARKAAAERPEDPAVLSEGARIDWGTFVLAMEKTAARLRTADTDTPGPVVVDCGRTIEAVVAVACCLEAGRPFLLLDDNPETRLQQTVRDSGSTTIVRLADAGAADRTKAGAFRLDNMLVETRTATGHDLGVPDDEIYRIYTSGSTGTPKGAAIPYRSVHGLLRALPARVPELDAVRRVSVTAAFGFDAALQQLLLFLHKGFTLTLPGRDILRRVDELTHFWERTETELSDATPVLLRMLTGAPRAVGSTLPVGCLLVGGEVLTARDVDAFWNRFGHSVALYNLYGVAECGIDAAVDRVTKADVERGSDLPVGHELDHCTVRLDDVGEASRGEPGSAHNRPMEPERPRLKEIVITGDAVGLGYRSTAGHPRANGASPAHPLREFRTGDLGYRLPDGRLVVVGRRDRQLKVLGRRVEPAEVESAALRWVEDSALRLLPSATSPSATSPSATGPSADGVRRCTRCVLSDAYPGANLVDDVCQFCRMDSQRIKTGWGYFRPAEDLPRKLAEARRRKTGEFDVLLLFSGGKDSSYALYQLIELGAKVVAFTFDNGFISASAFANIERICRATETPLIYGRPDDPVRLLAESVSVDATVCSGCFRGISGRSSAAATEMGVPFVVSGLSRGQIIDTKLLPFVRRGVEDLRSIDTALNQHRVLYLSRKDDFAESIGDGRATGASPEGALSGNPGAPSITLPTARPGPPPEALDYFRYDDAPVQRVREALAERDPLWAAPSDTGVCSSNCRANDAGIAAHLSKVGYHNYEGPLSWEVRLGVISREEALLQVRRRPDATNIQLVGHAFRRRTECTVVQDDRGRLVLFVTRFGLDDADGLLDRLRRELPAYMVPVEVRFIGALPHTAHGKVDVSALRRLARARQKDASHAPEGDAFTERVADVWADVLGRPVGDLSEDFFMVGGDSLSATQFCTRMESELGTVIPIATLFRTSRFEDMRDELRRLHASAAQLRDAGTDASGLRVVMTHVRSGTPRADGHPPALVLVPEVTGRQGPLLTALDQAAGGAFDVHSLEYAVGPAAGTATSGYDLVGALVPHVSERVRGRAATIVGWSAAADIAFHLACRLRRDPRIAPDQTLSCLLLDPPGTVAGAVEIAELRRSTARAIKERFPQLAGRLDSDDWPKIYACAERIVSYHRGVDSLFETLPGVWSELLKGLRGAPNDQLLSAIRTASGTYRFLEASTGSEDLQTRTDDLLSITVVRPSIAAMVASDGGSGGDYRQSEKLVTLHGADHYSMLGPAFVSEYARIIAT